MSHIPRIRLALKAFRELGPRQVGLYTWYQLGLRTGYFKRTMKAGGRKSRVDRVPLNIHSFLELPSRSGLEALLGEVGMASLLEEANEIVDGKVRLFGGPPVPLRLKPPGSLSHWTVYELGVEAGDGEDAKFIWETGRFGWAFTLGRAYYLSGDERYAEAFWDFTETFLDVNPTNMGPHWASAQEVAIRLVALAFASQVFAEALCSTPDRMARLAEALADHAGRIPPTMAYARAQNNNHLLVEAVGLYTAGIVLPDHPDGPKWRESGWHWFNRGLQDQIAEDGSYIQNSTNYHRLMLQIALWVNALTANQDIAWPSATLQRLSAATRWLVTLLNPGSGHVPNLGPNDGAYILPLTVCPFEDYRPVLQVASLTFCGEQIFDEGLWDEMGVWFQVARSMLKEEPATNNLKLASPHVLRSSNSWAYLRVARFFFRPGHADQLHLDLWWRGLNLTQDPGTYLYNAPPPWDNALTRTRVHNTLTVDGQDQMTYAGRFLWLDWAQGELVSHERAEDGSWESLTAQHNGYRSLHVTHQREVLAYKDDRWRVEDRLLPSLNHAPEITKPASEIEPSTANLPTHNLRIHWLMPDWSWTIENGDAEVAIRLESPYGKVNLNIRPKAKPLSTTSSSPLKIQLVRAGELVYGSGAVSPTRGWFSPTYGSKQPALSVSVELEGTLPLVVVSEWCFPDER